MLLPNNRLYEIISRSKERGKRTKTLIMGDSVTRQLFEELNGNDTITSLACNQAIDILGHYLLFREFTGRNDSINKVYLFYNPFSFKNDLNHKYTYNYFLKTFYRSKYKDELSTHARKQIKKIPYSAFASFPPVAITFWSPMYEPDEYETLFLSQTSQEYLIRMIQIAEEMDVDFEIISPPIKESRRDEVTILHDIYSKSDDTSEIFDMYFEEMIFLPDSLFMDKLHMKEEYISYGRKLLVDNFINK